MDKLSDGLKERSNKKITAIDTASGMIENAIITKGKDTLLHIKEKEGNNIKEFEKMKTLSSILTEPPFVSN